MYSPIFRATVYSPSKPSQRLFSAVLAVSVVAVSLLAFGGCAGGLGGGETILTINDTIKVSQGEYNKVYDAFVNQLGFTTSEEKKKALDDQVVSNMLKQTALNKIIFNKMLEADAKAQGVSVSDADLKAYKEEHLKKLGGEAGLAKILKQENYTMETFNEELKQNLLMERFVEKIGGSALAISDKEAQQFYTENAKSFDVQERIRAAHILIKAVEAEKKQALIKETPQITNAEVTELVKKFKAEKKAEAEKLLAQLQQELAKTTASQPSTQTPPSAGEAKTGVETPTQAPASSHTPANTQWQQTFEKLAREKSDDAASAVFGGDLDYLYQATTAKEFWDAAVKAKPGSMIPKLVETMFGYHIIWLKEHQPAHRMTFEEAKEQIVAMLKQQRMQTTLMNWVNGKRQTMKLVFSEKFPKPEGFDLGSPQSQQAGGAPAEQPQPQQPATKGG